MDPHSGFGADGTAGGRRDDRRASIRRRLRRTLADALDGDVAPGERNHTDARVLAIALLLEAMLFVSLASAAVLFALSLRTRFEHFTALEFRTGLDELVGNYQTRKEVEDATDLKIIDVGEYKSMVGEIDEAERKRATVRAATKWRSEHVDETKEEMEAAMRGYATEIPLLMSSLRLDDFCGECPFPAERDRFSETCLERVARLEDVRRRSSRFRAMLSAMKEDSCRISAN